MTNKRFLALALAGALTLSLLTACGGKTDPTPAPTPEASAPGVEDTAAPAPEGTPSTAPAESAAPVESAAPEESAPAAKPAESKPAADPTPAPTPEATPAPTEEPPASAVSVADIWESISGSMEQPSMVDLDDDLLDAFYGVKAGDLEEYVAKMPAMNVHATEFFIARVKSGKMDGVKAACEQRQKDLVAQWEQYLPEQLELVKKYELVTSGDYLLFCVCEDAAGAAKLFQDCTK